MKYYTIISLYTELKHPWQNSMKFVAGRCVELVSDASVVPVVYLC